MMMTVMVIKIIKFTLTLMQKVLKNNHWNHHNQSDYNRLIKHSKV